MSGRFALEAAESSPVLGHDLEGVTTVGAVPVDGEVAVEGGRARAPEPFHHRDGGTIHEVESQSGLVQEAVVEYLGNREREALREAYARAAADPAYAADVEHAMRDFAPLDEQTE